MSKVVNTSTTIQLVDVSTKLNAHIEHMNVQGWELMSVCIEAVGIQELFILFWRKIVSE